LPYHIFLPFFGLDAVVLAAVHSHIAPLLRALECARKIDAQKQRYSGTNGIGSLRFALGYWYNCVYVSSINTNVRRGKPSSFALLGRPRRYCRRPAPLSLSDTRYHLYHRRKCAKCKSRRSL